MPNNQFGGIKINPLWDGYQKYRNRLQWFLGLITMDLNPPHKKKKNTSFYNHGHQKNQRNDSDSYNHSSQNNLKIFKLTTSTAACWLFTRPFMTRYHLFFGVFEVTGTSDSLILVFPPQKTVFTLSLGLLSPPNPSFSRIWKVMKFY